MAGPISRVKDAPPWRGKLYDILFETDTNGYAKAFDILLIVAGGIPGPSCLVIPGWNTSSQAITQAYRTD